MQKLAFILCTFIMACSSQKAFAPATDALSAGIAFIDACLKGDFDKANFYMLQDEENKKLLQQAKKQYADYTKEEKKQLQEASLQNFTIDNITPSEAIVNCNDSYKKKTFKIKVVQQQSNWLADFKYTFNPNL